MTSKASAPRRSAFEKQFAKDWKRLARSGRYPMQELKDVMQFLIENRGIDPCARP
jgi:mRNA interferase YafQ